jgi:hypothetical protein
VALRNFLGLYVFWQAIPILVDELKSITDTKPVNSQCLDTDWHRGFLLVAGSPIGEGLTFLGYHHWETKKNFGAIAAIARPKLSCFSLLELAVHPFQIAGSSFLQSACSGCTIQARFDPRPQEVASHV